MENGPMEKIFEIYIRTTPERLWEAITDHDTWGKFQFGNAITSDFTPGSHVEITNPKAGIVLGRGTNVEVDPPHRLVQTMTWSFTEETEAEGETRVTWEIEQIEDSCRLTLTHDHLSENASPHIYGGWPMILSGLKTWLETGEVLTTPGSLMYG